MAGVEGRVALVTGAGRGIGRAVAELLTARGARVMAVARSEDELRRLGLDYLVADLGTAAGCSQAVEETERRLGAVEIFVCNHGIGSAHEKVIWEQDPQTWEETLRVNLDGPFHLTRLIRRGIGVDEVWAERAALYRPNRVATPQEVAETIAFLATEEASGVSGQAIRVSLGAQV
ncbi:MAG: SDR family NAD(P)-dependent oxidoreductase [Xanthomonadales bacterium]